MSTPSEQRTVHVRYFAALREQRGRGSETVATRAATPSELYEELAGRHGLGFGRDQLRVVVNDAYCDWSQLLAERDTVVFIPPVAGG